MNTLARLFVACSLVACTPLAASPVARGDVFGAISLVSQSATAQADYAHDPAISGDARYVAFDGSYGGIAGVWRRDLLTGAVAQVAPGDAELPSISADGRYVSFTTTAKLLPADENRGPDVYVRDMDEEEAQPSAFTLASAVTVEATTRGLAYGYGGEPAFEESHYGSVAAGRSALSADGRKVVFVTTAVSDLTDPQTPGEPRTPPMQVVVRDLETNETRLVSARGGSGEEPVSSVPGAEVHQALAEGRFYGAVLVAQLGKAPAFSEAPTFGQYAAGPPLGASISADGSTVSWMAVNVGQQATLLGGESRSPSYSEPLWRRIEPGSETAIERVTGGSDPSDPACVASGEQSLGNSPSAADPCDGPFATPEMQAPGIWAGGGDGDFVPRLSADGYTVAFIARAQLVSLGSGFGGGFEGPSDLYVVNMRPGLTRDQALTPLTQLASGNTSDPATTASIFDFDLSPDGEQVAFTTRRTQFVLGSPAYVTAPASQAGMGELFDVDLANDTLTRVTRGFQGGPSERPHAPVQTGRDPYNEGDGALSPSFSADGRQLAFSSTASNLTYGDGNSPPSETTRFDGSDAFVVERRLFEADAAAQYVSPAPASPALSIKWAISATARSLRDGSVRLYVRTPGAGTLRAGARSAVRVRAGGGVRGGPGRQPRRRAPGASARRERRGARVVTRTVASRSASARGEGLVTLTLKLAKPYAALARVRGGLSAAVKLSFAAAGHRTLGETIEVTFARAKRRPRPAGAGHASPTSAAAKAVARR
jgi:Tol biopolymer transport system component